MSGTDEPRMWTLNVQSEGQASWTLICRGWWLSPIETIEVVEKSAYDAAVDQAAIAQNHRHKAEAERDRHRIALEALVEDSNGVVAFNGAKANNRFYKAREAASAALKDKP